MTATITYLRLKGDKVFVIDVTTEARNSVGVRGTEAGDGFAIDDAGVELVEPTFLAGGPPIRSRVVAVGAVGRQLLAAAREGALRIRCRAVPEGMGWRLLSIAS